MELPDLRGQSEKTALLAGDLLAALAILAALEHRDLVGQQIDACLLPLDLGILARNLRIMRRDLANQVGG